MWPTPASPAWRSTAKSSALIGREIDKTNAQLSRVEQIKAFRILPKALDPEEEGEPVTPTRKVKRNLMYERFKTLVEDMYDDEEERLLGRQRGRRAGRLTQKIEQHDGGGNSCFASSQPPLRQR